MKIKTRIDALKKKIVTLSLELNEIKSEFAALKEQSTKKEILQKDNS